MRWGAWVGRRLGDIGYLVLGRRRRTALVNLHHAFPDRPAAARRRLARRSFQHLGVTLVELCSLSSRPLPHLLDRIRIDGLEHLTHVMATRGRALVLTGHLGNWELLAALCRPTGYSLSVVVRPLDHPWLDALATRLRLRTGAELIDKRRALRPVLRALAGGGLVAILLDQNATRSEGVFVPFFDRPASTSRSIAVLALRTGAPILPVFIRREGRGYHRVTIFPALAPPATNLLEPGIVELTARCTAALEAAIREAPEQWLWMHDRWRTRPLE